MMKCRLCYNLTSEESQNYLHDDDGQYTEVYEITLKYFDPLLINIDDKHDSYYSNFICNVCWGHIREFNDFQQSVLKTQNQLMEDKRSSLVEVNNDTEINLKVEYEDDLEEKNVTQLMEDKKGLLVEVNNDTEINVKVEYEDNLEEMNAIGEEIAENKKPKFPCDECGVQLYSCHGLKSHKAAYHNDGTTKFVCGICGEVAASDIALIKHKKRNHKEERNHKCTYCDKAFKRPLVLRQHMARHTGQDLCQCPHCPQTFKSSPSMNYHYKKVHPIEWEEGRKNRLQFPKVNINQ